MNTEIEQLEQKMLETARRNRFRGAQWSGEGTWRILLVGTHEEYPEIRLVYTVEGNIGVNWSSSNHWVSAALGLDFAKGLKRISEAAAELEQLRRQLISAQQRKQPNG